MSWFKRNGVLKRQIATMQAKMFEMAMRKGWIAAEVSNLWTHWARDGEPINLLIDNELNSLVARSRDQVRNNDYLRRFVQLAVSNVVGASGIKMQSQIMTVRGEPNESARSRVEDGWRDWGRRFVSESGRLTWLDIQKLCVRSIISDGEYFIRLRRDSRAGGVYRLTLEVIDSQRIPIKASDGKESAGSLNLQASNPANTVLHGIELAPSGRPVRYFVLDRAPAQGQTRSAKGTWVPAKDMIHVYVPEYAAQNRGIPYTATTLPTLKVLNEYQSAAATAAREGAAKQLYITMPDNRPYQGDVTLDSGAVGEQIIPGMKSVLPSGSELLSYDPNYPSGEYPTFIKTMLQRAGAGLRISYPTFANDYQGVNFSSGRMGWMEDRDTWKDLQQVMIDQLCWPVYEAWIMSSLSVLGTDIPPETWLQSVWLGRRWPWVDPLKEAQAAVLSVQNGMLSRSAVIRNTEGGQDPDDVFDEIAMEQEKMTAKGIEITTGSPIVAITSEAEDEPETQVSESGNGQG